MRKPARKFTADDEITLVRRMKADAARQRIYDPMTRAIPAARWKRQRDDLIEGVVDLLRGALICPPLPAYRRNLICHAT